ncbi:periplasmic chaperone for outer membrane proteins Skp [Polaribacter sp. Hel1_33_78]|uniref:OmpH family outer membrane protein n=1 Tax=Polaribacter sp. Hel1_33_78 TaxID=1336804 RepID=UPI00087C45DD|nr:OmpH family outer membrane protein [Polaribacter sp. Hel1_33_78]SDU04179.1 periplasmic chaperone for outer membrane proteins Skp [Polaribacter sp. Hel1_33_78]
MKSKITVLFIALLSTISIAQTKVGTIDSDYIMSLMPEAKVVFERSQAYGAKLDSSFSLKTQDFQAKVQNFKNKEEEMGELMKKTIIKEISALEEDIKKYQSNGNKLMQLKKNELMRPLYKILNNAINTVAKKNGYTQILTTKGNQFAYIDEKFDVTKLVIAELGIQKQEIKK